MTTKLPDRVRVEYNAAEETAQFPDWQPLVLRWPCLVESLTAEGGFGGREIEAGEQLVGEVDWRVSGFYHRTMGRLKANFRLCVLVGPEAGLVLSVVAVGPSRPPGMARRITLLCREEEPRAEVVA